MKKIFIVAVFAVVLLSACGRSTAVAPQTLPGQSQGQPAANTEQAAGPVLQGSDALNSLNSYRTKITMQSEKDGKIESSFVIVQEETRNPAAKRWIYDTSNTGQESKMEIISIDGKQWMNIGGSWMMSEQSPEDAAKAFGSDALNSFDVVGEFNKGNYTLVGGENVNGLNTKHYVLNVTTAEMTALTMGMTDVNNSKVDVWVADGG
ncbi:MAG: hypothetical protein HGA53_04625, partial [Anaerolineaceae bacterium]|nr:hypothetical protein [Anaerolineaceae bacterium]